MLSEEMKKKIANQSLKYAKTQVSANELTYIERISQKLEKLKDKAVAQTQKLGKTSRTLEDEASELNDYMTQYVEGLMASEGLSEEDAFIRAVAEFQVETPEESYGKKMEDYYRSFDPMIEEAIGLTYASRILIFGVIGAMLGMVGQIAYNHQVVGLVFVVMLLLGIIFGVGLALGTQAKLIKERNDKI